MLQVLTIDDVREFFVNLTVLIELDQARVEGLRREQVHPRYDDKLWRDWRQAHLDFINQVLPTVEEAPPDLLEDLSWVAATYDPAAVADLLIKILAWAAAEGAEIEELQTAEGFFRQAIVEIRMDLRPAASTGDPMSRLLKWVAFDDPLRISRDPECLYSLPPIVQ